ncbi:hypothetical protein BCR36DRAFT_579303 [Piromyces finnis]|uniref:Uncharacterized protein n=1 Tax=Piromyces finnis TaxID=1754191 RepID=A0A1Y1VML1_9FUNG|nr:hypothetical protein BCR36DRAFT_579303 [Piromyces finnis]|eukprot:ORX59852.1 hypothetical protein BCR36DRAFT_579303 [Piromyces finnis]
MFFNQSIKSFFYLGIFVNNIIVNALIDGDCNNLTGLSKSINEDNTTGEYNNCIKNPNIKELKNNNDNKSSENESNGMKGIIVVAIVLIILFIITGILLYSKCRKSNTEDDDEKKKSILPISNNNNINHSNSNKSFVVLTPKGEIKESKPPQLALDEKLFNYIDVKKPLEKIDDKKNGNRVSTIKTQEQYENHLQYENLLNSQSYYLD